MGAAWPACAGLSDSTQLITSSSCFSDSCGCGGIGIWPHVPTWPFFTAFISICLAPGLPAYLAATASKAGPTTLWPTAWQDRQSLLLATCSPSVAVSAALAASVPAPSRARPSSPWRSARRAADGWVRCLEIEDMMKGFRKFREKEPAGTKAGHEA